MMTFMEMKEPVKEVHKCLDSQFWHACAGGMVQMPPVNSTVFYFPQGYAEHANGNIDHSVFQNIPPLVSCKVSSIKYMADPNTDEVYAKIKLIPSKNNTFDDEKNDFIGLDSQEKPASFAKTLTQSDANNGGGFSVPRYCAETIFPRLDYTSDPPVQTILAKDVHDQIWKFRHIYRGTPRRHLLTTGWSNFVNQKKLVAGDSIVFLRAENGDLCVGIRRVKRGLGGWPENSTGWNLSTGNSDPPYAGYSTFMREDYTNNKLTTGMGKVRVESVIEAAKGVANGQPFEVVYYPRANTPEFCVKASSVSAAMRIHWCPGMRFKMAFETEDSSRISWFMGTISSVQVADPIHWPNSPWRLLQVAWDEPDLLQNVKRVSPWLAELVSNMPAIHLSQVSPQQKRKLPFPYPDFPLVSQFPIIPSFPRNNPVWPSSHISAGLQGARHAHYNSSSPNLLFNKRQFTGPTNFNEDIACLLSIGNSPQKKITKSPVFLLFGQPICTEEQISKSCSGETIGNSSSDDESDLVIGQCKVFTESDNVGRDLDLTVLGSYEELYQKLAIMFSTKGSDMQSNLMYQDTSGAVKHTGDKPFSEFLKTARKLTILTDSSSDNNIGRVEN